MNVDLDLPDGSDLIGSESLDGCGVIAPIAYTLTPKAHWKWELQLARVQHYQEFRWSIRTWNRSLGENRHWNRDSEGWETLNTFYDLRTEAQVAGMLWDWETALEEVNRFRGRVQKVSPGVAPEVFYQP